MRPHLLMGRELTDRRAALERFIAWYDAHAGLTRAELPADQLAQIAGDYRLARCLTSCLEGRSYGFDPPEFASAVRRFDTASATRPLQSRLLERGIDSPSALRLHVFWQVNTIAAGFVTSERREAVLTEIGAETGCTAAALEQLLWLDSPGNERLSLRGKPPAAEELARQYNRRALQTLLSRSISADLLLPAPDGAAIRRLYFSVKRAGLLCELSLHDVGAGPSSGVWAHLFGPLEVFGPRTRHGDRFADAVLDLLRTFPHLTGSARVLLNEREYTLHLTGEVRQIAAALPADAADAGLGETDDGSDEVAGEVKLSDHADHANRRAEGYVVQVLRPDEGDAGFDSEIERRLYTTLRGMERRGDARGWHVEREPEPIIHEGTVLVPDFRVTRQGGGSDPPQRVMVEVIGFWTPEYRERKRAKLLAIAGQVPLVLVVQEKLAEGFEALPFPLLPYRQRPSASDLILMLDRLYPRKVADAGEQRARLEALLANAAPEIALILEADARTELDVLPGAPLSHQIVEAMPAGWIWVPGLGATREPWLKAVRAECDAALGAGAESADDGAGMALEVLRENVAQSDVEHAGAAAAHLEALLPRMGFQVTWESLFDATVTRTAASNGAD